MQFYYFEIDLKKDLDKTKSSKYKLLLKSWIYLMYTHFITLRL